MNTKNYNSLLKDKERFFWKKSHFWWPIFYINCAQQWEKILKNNLNVQNLQVFITSNSAGNVDLIFPLLYNLISVEERPEIMAIFMIS